MAFTGKIKSGMYFNTRKVNSYADSSTWIHVTEILKMQKP